jgi:D-aminoacyl-tRNA deacylase
MRVVIQRVKKSSVQINGKTKSEIGQGLLIMAGIENEDNITDIEWLSNKIVQLRVFNDSNGIMNLSVKDIQGSIMVISQFTLHAKTKKGNRPSYFRAANSEVAIHLYNDFVELLSLLTGKKIATGEFGEMMEVELINDGPVTIFIDSRNKE